MRRVARWLAALGALLGLTSAAAASGRVVVRHFPEILDGRAIRIYLPPDYDEDASTRYPVLYMFDGQNLFDAATSFAGEWGVDESLDAGIAAGRIRPVLVVGADNGHERRIDEYTPWPYEDRGGAGGGGHEHLAAIVRDLKPRIDAEYRTLPDAAHTGLSGSSLGGLMTLYGALEFAHVFGRFGAFSPSLWWADERTVREFESRRPRDLRLYVDMGTRESSRLVDENGNGVPDFVDQLRRLTHVLERRLPNPTAFRAVEDEGGRHHESAWARRFPAAMEFLFPSEEAAGR